MATSVWNAPVVVPGSTLWCESTGSTLKPLNWKVSPPVP